MNNQQVIFELLKSVAGQENVLTIPRLFIDLTGDVKTALFLSQCLYWSDRSKCNKKGYFYKTHAEWEKELCLTRRDVDKARKKLVGILETKIMRADGSPTLHYKLNVEKLNDLVNSICTERTNPNEQSVQGQSYESDNSITETTPQTTTEIISPGSSHKEMVSTLEAICVMDMKIKSNAGRIVKASKALREADYTVDDLKHFGQWWYKNDFRGKKNQAPLPSQVLSEILKSKTNGRGQPTETDAEIKARLLAAANAEIAQGEAMMREREGAERS